MCCGYARHAGRSAPEVHSRCVAPPAPLPPPAHQHRSAAPPRTMLSPAGGPGAPPLRVEACGAQPEGLTLAIGGSSCNVQRPAAPDLGLATAQAPNCRRHHYASATGRRGRYGLARTGLGIAAVTIGTVTLHRQPFHALAPLWTACDAVARDGQAARLECVHRARCRRPHTHSLLRAKSTIRWDGQNS